MVTNGMMLIHKSTQFLVQKHVECSALGIQQTQKRHIQIKNAGSHLVKTETPSFLRFQRKGTNPTQFWYKTAFKMTPKHALHDCVQNLPKKCHIAFGHILHEFWYKIYSKK